jgi:hypothetical protein
MDSNSLFTIAKILFFILFLLTAITVIVGFIRKGRKFSNTDWPYSNLKGIRFFHFVKYMDKRGWKFSKREYIGLILVIILMIVGSIINKVMLDR